MLFGVKKEAEDMKAIAEKECRRLISMQLSVIRILWRRHVILSAISNAF